jgi:hypothetical protein
MPDRITPSIWRCTPALALAIAHVRPGRVVDIPLRGRSFGSLPRELAPTDGANESLSFSLINALDATRAESRQAIEDALRAHTYVAVVLSLSLAPESGEWRASDLIDLPLISLEMTTEDARDIALAIFSTSDPVALGANGPNLAHALNGHAPDHLNRVLDRLAEQSFELGLIKNSTSYRLSRRLRQNIFWKTAQRLRGRQGLLELRPLGQRSARAHGDEVWLLSARADAGHIPVPWEFVDIEGPWLEKRDATTPYGRSYVASGGTLKFVAGEDPELEFLSHSWSGKVEIRFKDRREVIDLYSPDSGSLRIYPGRTPMCARPVATAKNPSDPVTSKPSGERWTTTQRGFIERCRASNTSVVAVHCPRWLGVTNSTRNLFDACFPVPESPAEEPYRLDDARIEENARVLLEAGARHVVFSGGDEAYLRMMQTIRRLDPKVRCDMLWHGNIVQWSDDYAWNNLTAWMDAAKTGEVHSIGTVKKGMEQVISAAGVRSRFVMNYVPGDSLDAPPLDEFPENDIQVGLWMSGTLWKTPNVMLAALKLLDQEPRRITLHTAGVDQRTREIADYLGLRLDTVHDKTLPHQALLDQMRRTHLTMYVTFNECCPMIPLESLSVGVPCLVGPTSHLFEDDSYLFSRLVVPFPDRAEVIASFAERAIEERRDIISAYRKYRPAYNERARKSVAEFLAG